MPEDAIQVVISTISEVLPRVLASHAALIDATVKQPIVCCTTEDAALTTAAAAVQAKGEQLGNVVVSDATTVSLLSVHLSSLDSLLVGCCFLELFCEKRRGKPNYCRFSNPLRGQHLRLEMF